MEEEDENHGGGLLPLEEESLQYLIVERAFLVIQDRKNKVSQVNYSEFFFKIIMMIIITKKILIQFEWIQNVVIVRILINNSIDIVPDFKIIITEKI